MPDYSGRLPLSDIGGIEFKRRSLGSLGDNTALATKYVFGGLAVSKGWSQLALLWWFGTSSVKAQNG